MSRAKRISIVSALASWVLLILASPPLLAQTDADSRAARGDVVGDLDGDDDTDQADLAILLAHWGQTCP